MLIIDMVTGETVEEHGTMPIAGRDVTPLPELSSPPEPRLWERPSESPSINPLPPSVRDLEGLLKRMGQ